MDAPESDSSHWNEVYASKDASEVSWFEAVPTTSVRLVKQASSAGSTVVDIGAGASALADLLVADGFDVTVLDISDEALGMVRTRLGDDVTYVIADVLEWRALGVYDIWHDRAVFHFLIDERQQRDYAVRAAETVAPGGAVVIGTFAPHGPTACSGLPTARHDAGSLAAIFGEGFELEHSEIEEHRTPGGTAQPFTWVILRRR